MNTTNNNIPAGYVEMEDGEMFDYPCRFFDDDNQWQHINQDVVLAFNIQKRSYRKGLDRMMYVPLKPKMVGVAGQRMLVTSTTVFSQVVHYGVIFDMLPQYQSESVKQSIGWIPAALCTIIE